MGEAIAVQLRDYQEKAIAGLRSAFQEGKRAPLLALPTGGGKTVVFCFVAASAAAKGRKVLVLVHRAELLRQTSRALERLEVRHGLIAPGCTPTMDLVQVASVQTLARRLDRMAWRPDLIVVDEAHHAVAGTWGQVLAYYPEARVLGVTATPCRLDGRGLGDVFDHLVIGPTTRELMDRGFLCRATVYAPPTVADLSGIKMVAGDYNRGDLVKAVDKPAITGDAVAHYQKLMPGKPAIAFCASVEHAEHVADLFGQAGFRARSLDGKMDDAERKSCIEGLGNGHIQVLTSCDIVSEGTDIPVVTGAILLRPTQSESLYLQQVGRVLRPAPGKDRAIVLDHVGNVARHGLPQDDREWSLDASRKKKRKAEADEVPIRQCPQCYVAHEPEPRCPGCGFVYPVKQRDMEQRDGELQEVDPEAVQKRQRHLEVGKARTLADLLAIEKARGYRAGWAAHVFASRSNRRTA